MTRLPELFDEAVGRVEPTYAVDDVIDRVARRRRSRVRRVAGMLIVIALLGAASAIAVAGRHGTARRVQIQAPAPSSVPAAGASDDVVVFDETGGVAAVDLAGRVVSRVPIEGWRPGDQPFQSTLVDGNIVVGWGDVYATPIEGGAASKLGTGVFVPAAEPGAVWLTSYGQVQTATERLVDMHGRVIESGQVPGTDSFALVGVPGGLAFQSGTGIDIWDAAAGRVTRHLGTTVGSAAPAYGSMLPWCDRCDRALELTDLATGATREVALDLADGGDLVRRARFSPDGTQLAVAVASAPDGSTPTTADVAIVDVATGEVRARFETGHQYVSFAWSPDGKRLYASGTSTGGAGELLEYDTIARTTTNLGSEPAGAGDIKMVVSRSAADGLLIGATPGPASACPAPVVYPDNTTRRCSFHY